MNTHRETATDLSGAGATRRPTRAALAFIIAANTAASAVVIALDRVPPTHDVLFMSRAAAMLARAVRGESGMWSGFLDATRDLFYPPLIHFAALLFTLIDPASFGASALSISLFAAVLVLAVFSLTRRIGDESTGLAAAVLAVLAPATLGFSRVYLVDLPLAALVAASLATAFATDRFSSRKFSIVLGVLCGCGLLVKQTFVIYAAPAVTVYALAALVRAKGPHERARRLAHVGLAALACALVAGWWYAPRAIAMIGKQETINALARALEPDRADLIDFLRLALWGAGGVIAPLAIVGLVLAPRDRHGAALAAALVVPFAILPLVLVIMTPRYVLPLIPIGAVLAATALHRAPRTIKTTVVVVAIAGAFAQAAIVTLARPAGPIDDTEIHARFQEHGLLRPQFTGPAPDALADAIRGHHADGPVVLLLDRPVTQMVQSRLFERDPLFRVENLFERASMGILPPDRDEAAELGALFDAADLVLVAFEGEHDDEQTARAVSIPASYTSLVFAEWRARESAFAPIAIVASGPLRLVVMKRVAR